MNAWPILGQQESKLLYFILDLCLKLIHMECLKTFPQLRFFIALNCCFRWNPLTCVSTSVCLPWCWQYSKPWEDANTLLYYTSPLENLCLRMGFLPNCVVWKVGHKHTNFTWNHQFTTLARREPESPSPHFCSIPLSQSSSNLISPFYCHNSIHYPVFLRCLRNVGLKSWSKSNQYLRIWLKAGIRILHSFCSRVLWLCGAIWCYN